ncbi:MAG: beta-N-acetylglucosaminidase domain-containing protein [Candidatus Marinimicrobia bacterium]|nr:beta-N-acetylglucosaminidase domain-containing protein [Candidatus Neomarinimicrobiota bacterium]
MYSIAPGLDILYSGEDDWNHLINKINQVLSLGCVQFAILFDDIPFELSIEDRSVFSSFAHAQGHVTNRLYDTLQKIDSNSSLIFCPTVYCGRMEDYDVPGNAYLEPFAKPIAQIKKFKIRMLFVRKLINSYAINCISCLNQTNFNSFIFIL